MRLRPLLLLLAVLLPAGGPRAADDGAPGAAAFTRRYAEALREALPDAKVVVDGELALRLVPKAGGDHVISLGNAYADAQLDPEHVEAVIGRYVAAQVEAATTVAGAKSVARDRIVPVLKPREMLEGVVAQLREARRRDPAGKAPEPLWEELSGGLIVMYAEDTPRNMRFLSAADVEGAGVTRAELRALALRNLVALLPDVRVEEVRAGIYALEADHNYEATLILADEVVARFPKVDGDLVFVAPARDVLLFTGSRNGDGIELLRRVALKLARESGHPLSDQVFVRRGGTIEPL
jgi:uncharacterized protein YtpQ (UPF0354 family)